jgi:hypothetical protein
LLVDEAAEANYSEDDSDEDGDKGTFGGPEAPVVKSLRDVAHANIISN